MNRKITFDQEKSIPIEKIILWKVIGFDIVHGMTIIKNTLTGELQGRYASTGSCVILKNDQLPVVDWSFDAEDNQIEETKKIYEFIKPPPEKNSIHSDTCGCIDCKELNKAIEITNQKEKTNGE